MYLLMYVDDTIVTSSSQWAMNRLVQQLHEDFAVKDLGKLHYFLGIEVNPNNDGIVLTQQKHTRDLLHRANMDSCKPVSTPMSTSEKLSSHQGDSLSEAEATNYRSIVGALQYSALTGPDIAYSVNKICRYLHLPTSLHWTTVT